MLGCALCASCSQLTILLSSPAVLSPSLAIALSSPNQAKSLLKGILQSPFTDGKSASLRLHLSPLPSPVRSNVKIMSDQENDIWQEIWTVSLVQHPDLALAPQLRSTQLVWHERWRQSTTTITLVSSLERSRGSSHINGLWQQELSYKLNTTLRTDHHHHHHQQPVAFSFQIETYFDQVFFMKVHYFLELRVDI